jgi:hypothetical protein
MDRRVGFKRRRRRRRIDYRRNSYGFDSVEGLDSRH